MRGRFKELRESPAFASTAAPLPVVAGAFIWRDSSWAPMEIGQPTWYY